MNEVRSESSVMSHHEYCDTRDPIIRTKPCNCPPGWPRAGAGLSVKPVISDGEVRGLIRHYTRMSKLKGAVNYDKVAALLTELLARRKVK